MLVHATIQFLINIYVIEKNLECRGKKYENVSLTAYFPDFDDEELEDSIYDKRGKKLRTLQVCVINVYKLFYEYNF